MKTPFSYWFCLFIFLLLPSAALAQFGTIDQIDLFASDITINQDTSISIAETIQYRTNLNKHGIYRYIPVTYNKDGQREMLRVSDVEITDENGKDLQFVRKFDGQFLTLKIGDPDRTFTGAKTYRITYRVERAVSLIDGQPELFWDITGEGWQIPVMNSQATIRSPFAEIVQVACFSGKVGSDNRLCESSSNSETVVDFSYGQPIRYGENLTISLRFPEDNNFIFPTSTQLLLLWVKYNWAILLLPIPISLMMWWWWKKGRDWEFISDNVFELDTQRPTRQITLQMSSREPFVYEPLKDLTPGEAGGLLNEKIDTQDVVAEIMELARKKFLAIEVLEKKKLFTTTREYQLTKLKNADTSLPEVQKFMHEKLFAKKDVITTTSLKGKFYTTMETAKKKLEQSLVNKKVYISSPTSSRAKSFTIFFVLIGVVTFAIFAQFVSLDILWPLGFILIQIPFGCVLAYNMPQKTAVGRNLWLQARGLRKTIQYGKWREEIKEKNLFVEEVFPFAIALGVVDQLSRHMEALNIKPPQYLNSTALTAWNTSQLLSSFGTEMGETLSYNPSSSRSSGGSGFSGGSSGGGGGGGGGGSW